MRGRIGYRNPSPAIRIVVVALPALIVGLLYIAFPPHLEAQSGFYRSQYILPSDVLKKGISFATVRIPLNRPDVSRRIAEQVNYLLMDRRAGMMEWFDRTAEVGPVMRRVLRDEKVPEDLIYLPALLSGMTPNATTRSGGVGWWALGSVKDKAMPSIAQWVSTNNWDDRRDPVLSTRIACTILNWIHQRKRTNDWLLAICAFIDGTERIDDVVEKTPGFSYWDMVMPPRSEVIIPRLIALKIIDGRRDLYGVDVKTPAPTEYDYLDRLKLVKDLPLYKVAQWCRTNPRSIWELNPGVDPSTGLLPKAEKRCPSGFPLRVPKGKAAKVRAMLVREGYLSG